MQTYDYCQDSVTSTSAQEASQRDMHFMLRNGSVVKAVPAARVHLKMPPPMKMLSPMKSLTTIRSTQPLSAGKWCFETVQKCTNPDDQYHHASAYQLRAGRDSDNWQRPSNAGRFSCPYSPSRRRRQAPRVPGRICKYNKHLGKHATLP